MIGETTSPTTQFQQAMADAGLLGAEQIIADGKIHRFHVEGDKPGTKNGWHVFYGDDVSAGAFGSWRTGQHETLCSQAPSTFSPDQHRAWKEQIEAAKDERDRKLAQQRADAARNAREIWAQATSVGRHPYLERKAVKAFGVKRSHGSILIPLCDEGGTIHSIQYIDDAGNKRFLFGGAIQGHFHAIGNVTQRIWLAEGYATAASVYEAVGEYTVVAFNAGNLEPVAKAIQQKHPEAKIVLVADNDQWTEGNPGITKAQEAVEAIHGEIVIPQFPNLQSRPKDFNDLHCLEGLEEVKRQLDQATPTIELPIDLDMPRLPDIPSEIFPDWVKDMVDSVACATETPRELGSLLAFAVLAACCQKTFVANPESGYIEPVNLWVVPAMDSGNRKTPVLEFMTKPLKEWERERATQVAQEMTQKESERETILARIKALQSKAANGKSEDFEDKKREILELQQSLPTISQPPRLWAQDITPERLGPLMAENGERLAILSDEGGIFDLMGGRYNNGIPNLDVFLQSYSGSSVRVDRQGRPSVYMRHPALTIGLSPQPEVLRGLTDKSKSGFRGKGLLARFLYAMPMSRLGYRTFDTQPISSSVLAAYTQGIQALLNIQPDTDLDGSPKPFTLKFSDQAHNEWKEFSRTVEKDMREGGKFEYLTDWAGKLPGNAVRIASLLHCAEYAHTQPWSSPISLNTIKQALEFVAALAPHALAAFDLMGADPELEGARKVWRWIKRMQKKTISVRDCFQALKGTFKRMNDLEPALNILKERFYLIQKASKDKPGGRPKREFTVNPTLTEGWN